MWSSSPYAEPPPFISVSLMSGTPPTLAGRTGSSTGCPEFFAHSARPGADRSRPRRGHVGATSGKGGPTSPPGRDRGREDEPPGHALDDARGPLTRGVARLCHP